jgi:hypothetical protein
MHADENALIGRPLKTDEIELAEKLSAWAESDQFEITGAAEVLIGAEAEAAGRALMDVLVGEEALERAINGGSHQAEAGRAAEATATYRLSAPHTSEQRPGRHAS